MDRDGDVVREAEVLLFSDKSSPPRKTATDDSGHYHFGGVQPGSFRLTVTSAGMTEVSFSGTLVAGQTMDVPAMTLTMTSVDASVQVFASQEELAEAEIKVEEHQRLGGVVPNFFVSYDWNAPALTSRQKFELTWRNVLDPVNIGINAATAGVQQADNAPSGYGRGPAAYGKRFGADSGDLLVGTTLGGWVLPVLFHQDPRYFYKGTGSIKSRTWYALTRAVVARGDNGKWQPSYSGIVGDLGGGAISNLYYPKQNRDGAALTFENGLLGIAEDAIGNVVQEFVFKHFTPHAPNYATAPNP